jgi:hypothetical protein
VPTGTCNYPHHHGSPSAGPPVGLLLAIIAGALIITHVHLVVVTLAVAAVLAVLGAGVAMLWHSHRSAPYDAAWAGHEHRTEQLPATPAELQLQARVVQLERQLAERRAVEAPQQHLHIHGVSADDLAAIIAQHRAIEE